MIIDNIKKKLLNNTTQLKYLGFEKDYYNYLKNGKRLILSVMAGRSGLRWLANIFSAHNNATGSIERHPEYESFYRYVKWNQLPIDIKGIINITKDSIVQDWQKHDLSMVASPYYSHDLLNLSEVLKPASIIWAMRDAKAAVSSFYNKGWYLEENARENINLVNGMQAHSRINHSFGRLIPFGDEYKEWEKLTRIGKISWFYNKVNMEIYSYVNKLPDDKIFIFKLEEADQNYKYYQQLAEKYELKPILTKKKFLALKIMSKNIQKKMNEKEENEFEYYTSDFQKIYKTL
jgi:hypothetical protein